ncbi:MAG: hypothetical protein R2745_10145 [Vicinamibacterales bacterium]
MKPLRAADVRRAVGAAGRAISAALDTRHKSIDPEMLNSAGSVSAEWYIETLWHYLAKRSLLDGVSSFDVEFRQPARPSDKQLHFALPHPEDDDLVMDFHVMRQGPAKRPEKVPVARIEIHRGRRRRHGVAPDPPMHPYGIEVRTRHLNERGNVSWYTMVAVIMDVARRGLQFDDPRVDREDDSLLYIVPRFSFTPLADAALCQNLFVYPEFSVDRPWRKGRTSATARITMWAAANAAPWPIAESVVTVVRTSVVDGQRRPVDDHGRVPRTGT